VFLEGQQFSDFMQEMLVMMDNVKNEVGAQPPTPTRILLLTTSSIIVNARNRVVLRYEK
jgi:hypothetical protein